MSAYEEIPLVQDERQFVCDYRVAGGEYDSLEPNGHILVSKVEKELVLSLRKEYDGRWGYGTSKAKEEWERRKERVLSKVRAERKKGGGGGGGGDATAGLVKQENPQVAVGVKREADARSLLPSPRPSAPPKSHAKGPPKDTSIVDLCSSDDEAPPAFGRIDKTDKGKAKEREEVARGGNARDEYGRWASTKRKVGMEGTGGSDGYEHEKPVAKRRGSGTRKRQRDWTILDEAKMLSVEDRIRIGRNLEEEDVSWMRNVVLFPDSFLATLRRLHGPSSTDFLSILNLKKNQLERPDKIYQHHLDHLSTLISTLLLHNYAQYSAEFEGSHWYKSLKESDASGEVLILASWLTDKARNASRNWKMNVQMPRTGKDVERPVAEDEQHQPVASGSGWNRDEEEDELEQAGHDASGELDQGAQQQHDS